MPISAAVIKTIQAITEATVSALNKDAEGLSGANQVVSTFKLLLEDTQNFVHFVERDKLPVDFKQLWQNPRSFFADDTLSMVDATLVKDLTKFYLLEKMLRYLRSSLQIASLNITTLNQHNKHKLFLLQKISALLVNLTSIDFGSQDLTAALALYTHNDPLIKYKRELLLEIRLLTDLMAAHEAHSQGLFNAPVNPVLIENSHTFNARCLTRLVGSAVGVASFICSVLSPKTPVNDSLIWANAGIAGASLLMDAIVPVWIRPLEDESRQAQSASMVGAAIIDLAVAAAQVAVTGVGLGAQSIQGGTSLAGFVLQGINGLLHTALTAFDVQYQQAIATYNEYFEGLEAALSAATEQAKATYTYAKTQLNQPVNSLLYQVGLFAGVSTSQPDVVQVVVESLRAPEPAVLR